MFHGVYGRTDEMKTVLLAGGKGTRIGEESRFRPKPMVTICGQPILWHIMRWYASFEYKDFIICCGYKGQMIKEYFLKYHMNHSDVMFDFCKGGQNTPDLLCSDASVEDWNVTLANTGLETLTAGRILKIRPYVGDEEFMLTYGDGVSDVDLNALLAAHHDSGRICTITVTKPAGRFGAVLIDEKSHAVLDFREKARVDQSYVNAGFMVCRPEIFDYLGTGDEMLEKGPFEKLAAAGQMNAYIHPGFWSPMDSMKDREYLENLAASGNAPWIPAV